MFYLYRGQKSNFGPVEIKSKVETKYRIPMLRRKWRPSKYSNTQFQSHNETISSLLQQRTRKT